MSGVDAKLTLARPGFRLDAAIEAPPAGITAVFGPSGSGKTTLLRCLAGLERGARGHVRVGEQWWQSDSHQCFVRPHRRAVGYVFQDGRLFPHLSARENLCYGLRRAQRPAEPNDPNFDHVVDILGIGHLLDRYPRGLSGGEQQRVAIGRALLVRPRLLLMDEPMASLDIARKYEVLPFLEHLHAELAIPMLYVSHSLDEVIRLADQLILIDHGRTRPGGPPEEVLARLDLPLAHAEQASTLIEARIVSHDVQYDLARAVFDGGELLIGREAPLGETVRILVRARDVSLALTPARDSSILNIVPARITGVAHEPAGRITVQLTAGRARFLARITRKSFERLGLREGQQVYAQIKSVALAR